MEQNREFRELVQKEKEKLAKEEIFESAFYKQLLLSVASEITGGTLKQVELKKEPESPWAGKCSEKQVYLNLLNSITVSFPTLPLKSDSLFGILGHECGHWNFSDFSLHERKKSHSSCPVVRDRVVSPEYAGRCIRRAENVQVVSGQH